MIKHDKILFESGRILKTQMLEMLQSFSLRNLEICYEDYSDGIITGLDFVNDEKKLYITSGILKDKGKYFFLEKKIEIFDFSKEGGKKYIYLKRDKETEENNIRTKILHVEIGVQLPESDFIYLGEFEHHQNTPIETEYNTYEDLIKDGSFVDIRKRKYAGEFRPTVSPILLYLFAREKQKHRPKNYLETMIITNGLNKEIVNFNILIEYLGEKLSIENCYNKLSLKIEEHIQHREVVSEVDIETKKPQENKKQGFVVE